VIAAPLIRYVLIGLVVVLALLAGYSFRAQYLQSAPLAALIDRLRGRLGF